MTNTVGFSSCKTRCFMHIFTETVNQIKVMYDPGDKLHVNVTFDIYT